MSERARDVVSAPSDDDPTLAPLFDGMPAREIRATLESIAIEQHVVGIDCSRIEERATVA